MPKMCSSITITTVLAAFSAMTSTALCFQDTAESTPNQTELSIRVRPALLLVEVESVPQITLSWHSTSKGFVRYSQDLEFSNDAGRVPIGGNVEGFAAVGGTRITKSAGHPEGAVVKAGFYKLDSAKPWFVDIDIEKPITVTISGVRFNQPVQAPTNTSLLHMKYSTEDLESCGLPGSARAMIATASMIENLNRRVRPGIDARLGVLSTAGPGSVYSAIDSDGLVTVTASFPYKVLKNLQDPWRSELPGTFLEPIHFHFEFEAIPEGVEPLDWEQLGKNLDAFKERLDREGIISTQEAMPPDVGPDFVPQEKPAEPTDETETQTQTETE